MFSDSKGLISHLELKHSESFIQYVCSRCGTRKPYYNRIAIHYGKCKKAVEGAAERTQVRPSVTPPDTGLEVQNRFSEIEADIARDPEPETEPA